MDGGKAVGLMAGTLSWMPGARWVRAGQTYPLCRPPVRQLFVPHNALCMPPALPCACHLYAPVCPLYAPSVYPCMVSACLVCGPLCMPLVCSQSAPHDPAKPLPVVRKPTGRWCIARRFIGCLCEVRVWRVARAGAEIHRDMSRPLSGKETGLVAYYPMTEGSGNRLYDRSLYQNHVLAKTLAYPVGGGGAPHAMPTWIEYTLPLHEPDRRSAGDDPEPQDPPPPDDLVCNIAGHAIYTNGYQVAMRSPAQTL